MTDEGAGTKLSYSVEASVGGKLGQIGGRLIDSSAKKMADEFFAAFDSALTGGTVETGAVAAPAGAVYPISVGPSVAGAAGGTPSFGGGFAPELYRAFWFSLGVAFTLFVSHWLR